MQQRRFMSRLSTLVRWPLLSLFRAFSFNQPFLVGPILFVIVGILLSLVSSLANLFLILITEYEGFFASLSRLFGEFVASVWEPASDGNEQPSSPKESATFPKESATSDIPWILYCYLGVLTVVIFYIYVNN